MPDTMTLEQAQQRIIELTEENQTLTAERDKFSQDNENLTSECENLRKLNQTYFNKLIAQDAREKHEEDPEPEDVPSCEEFAKTLNI